MRARGRAEPLHHADERDLSDCHSRSQRRDDIGERAPVTRYAYKASLIGSAHQFELTDDGLSWRIGSKSGVWPYADIASIRLSYRPMSMQSRRFRADIERPAAARIVILSTTWQTVALMTPQDRDYRAFITQLHRG